MSGQLKFLSAIAFEDLRVEATGLLSMMGVVGDGQFDFEKLPSRGRLALVLIADIAAEGDITIKPQLRFNGEVKWAAEMELSLESAGTGIVVPLGSTFYVFDKPGELELTITVDGSDEEHFIKSWPVTVDPDLDDDAEAPSA